MVVSKSKIPYLRRSAARMAVRKKEALSGSRSRVVSLRRVAMREGKYSWIRTPGGPRIPVFRMVSGARVSDVAGLSNSVRSGTPAVFGDGAEVQLVKGLKADSADGTIFIGFFGTIPDKVIIKVPNAPIGKVLPTGRIVSSGEEAANFEDVMKEYVLMSQVDCMQGPIICALAAVALVIGTHVYNAIALEYMDTSSTGYIDKLRQTAAPQLVAKQAVLLVLKAIRNLRRLHEAGFMHMDAHSENWLVKYKGIAPMDVDVRLADMGRSCITKDKDRFGCRAMTSKGDVYGDYAYYNLIEYCQFMHFVTAMLDRIVRMLPKSARIMYARLRPEYESIRGSYFTYPSRLMTDYPREVGERPFEYWMVGRKWGLVPMMEAIVRDGRFYTATEESKMRKEGLWPE